MQQKLSLAVLATTLLLVGCTSKPVPPSEKLVQTQTVTSANQSQLAVEGWQDLETNYSRPSDTQLHYVTQGDTSKAAALKTLQFVSMMFVGGQIQSFGKEQLRGTEVAGVMNPSLAYLTPRVSEILKTEMDHRPTQKYDKPLIIKPLTWKLIYKNLSGGDDNYQLVMSTTLTRFVSDNAGHATFQQIDCKADTTTPEFTLPQWQANNYAKVNEVTQKIMDRCLVKFTSEVKSFFIMNPTS
ncbi:hypothetical protein [Pantoea sp. At-9b]|uniref:hypothetical protein n=1 Tax=Pantoea sp. (strain At-9b) TaxID=592316 RepID=UPI0001B406F6|nr:hypothetical protein [Pantoea sp. At-9b]ADU72432.1 conserved hypothetical protein [Pantoea sp. At-9b]